MLKTSEPVFESEVRTMSYLPSRLNDLLAWAQAFGLYISTNFAAVGLTTGQQSAYNTLVGTFSSALAESQDPSTRTPVTVQATRDQEIALRASTTQLVAEVQAFPGTTDVARAAMGLTIRKTTRTPVPTPTAVPVLSANRLVSLQVTLRVNDVENNSNRFPPNTVGANIYMKIGDTVPASIAECVFVGRMTKRFLTIDYAGADANKAVHFFAAYVTRTNKEGPSSALLSTTVPM
jgi:hypothetical protein